MSSTEETEILHVTCPECQAKAQISKAPELPARITCAGCGFQHEQQIDQRLRYGMQRIYAGHPVDPYFGLQLWRE